MHLKNRIIFKSQSGDTIIEVLISLAIVSLVFFGSYTSINASSQNFENGQEYSEAITLVESQIESLHSYSLSATPACFNQNGVVQPTGSGCYFNTSGILTASSAPQPLFQINITGSASTVYKVTATWTSIISGNPDNVTMYYGPN